MKSMIAFTLAFGLAAAGVTSAGMQGQGADSEGNKKPEYEEKNPGGYRDSQTTGTQRSGAAAKEKAVSSDKSDSASPTPKNKSKPAEAPYQGGGHILVDSSDLEWGPVSSMAPGAKIAMIEGNLDEEKPFTLRLWLPADYEIAPHVHPAYERVTVLSGTLYFAHSAEFDRARAHALPAGSVAIMSPGDPMFGYTEEETVIQLHGTGPWGIEYIDPKDDPRN